MSKPENKKLAITLLIILIIGLALSVSTYTLELMADTQIMESKYDAFIQLSKSEERKFGVIAFAFSIICLVLYALELAFNINLIKCLFTGEDSLPCFLKCLAPLQKFNNKFLSPACSLVLLVMIGLCVNRTTSENKDLWIENIADAYRSYSVNGTYVLDIKNISNNCL